MISQEIQEKYATLALKTGVNLQKGQALMINSSIEGADFTRTVVKKAYELGAKDVHVNWSDDELTLLKYTHASDEVLAHFPDWRVDLSNDYIEDGAAILSISSTNPDLLKDIDPSRIALANKASAEKMTRFQDYIMNDKVTWSVISIPTGDWAQKVFPDKSREAAKEALWEVIVNIVRVDQDDPLAAWEEHNKTLGMAVDVLNEKKYKKLILKGPGTNLEIGLPTGHIWAGGSAESESGLIFNPNMPTEEVFCMPHKYEVDGVVSSTMPLNYGGSLIDNFSLTFEKGKVIDFTAETGEDSLKHLLDTDDGARRLGEVALVPDESPISKSGLIFYNTLFDENASCHIALGKAYPINIEHGSTMSKEELDQHGVNDSLTHVDFMIGSSELDIDGVKEDGSIEAVFRNGTWALDVTGK